MSYEEKGQWVYLAATTLAYTAYLVLMLGRAGETALPEIEYQPIMLGTIAVAVVGSVIGRIAVEIARPGEPVREDVRDRDIGRRGDRTRTSLDTAPGAAWLAEANTANGR